MSVFSEIDGIYQEIIAEYVASDYTSAAEQRIWEEIGVYDMNLAGELVDVYQCEAALYAIEHKQIPHNNATWQQIVIRLAYNALTDMEAFTYFLDRTNRQLAEVQRLIDLAMFVILGNKNFKLAKFATIQ